MSGMMLPSIRRKSHEISEDLPSQLNSIQERLCQQERMSQVLIKQAVKIKEEIMRDLAKQSHEKAFQSGGILQEHIKTITNVVNYLNQDIKELGKQISLWNQAHRTTVHAMETLEIHHAKTLTDLRSRIVRCDSSITKLNSLINQNNNAIKVQNENIERLEKKIVESLHDIEIKMLGFSTKLDQSINQYERNTENIERKLSSRVSHLDSTSQNILHELQMALDGNIKRVEADIKKTEIRLTENIKNENSHFLQLKTLEHELSERHHLLNERLSDLEEKTRNDRKITETFISSTDEKLRQKMKLLEDEIDHWKKDCVEGFSAVHDGLNNIDNIMQNKYKLTKQQLWKEISQIRKMVVLM